MFFLGHGVVILTYHFVSPALKLTKMYCRDTTVYTGILSTVVGLPFHYFGGLEWIKPSSCVWQLNHVVLKSRFNQADSHSTLQ